MSTYSLLRAPRLMFRAIVMAVLTAILVVNVCARLVMAMSALAATGEDGKQTVLSYVWTKSIRARRNVCRDNDGADPHESQLFKDDGRQLTCCSCTVDRCSLPPRTFPCEAQPPSVL